MHADCPHVVILQEYKHYTAFLPPLLAPPVPCAHLVPEVNLFEVLNVSAAPDSVPSPLLELLVELCHTHK